MFAHTTPSGSSTGSRMAPSRRPDTGESTVTQSAAYPAASARAARSRISAWSSVTYGWNHRGHVAASATSSMVRFEPMLSPMKTPAAVAARAVATSPSGSRRPCSANGAIPIGIVTRRPRMVVERSRALVSTSTRGMKRHRAKASMFSRIVRSSPAPPATYTYAPGDRRCLAIA